jgi:hypothetical protein
MPYPAADLIQSFAIRIQPFASKRLDAARVPIARAQRRREK